MEDIKTNNLERKWGNNDGTIELHGSSGRELIVRDEYLALLKMCDKAKMKAKRTKKYKQNKNKR